MPAWYEIKPKALSKKDANHPWLFAVYCESPSEGQDGRRYELLLFRNEDRTRFGKIEFYELVQEDDLRKLAPRVVLVKDFRKSLISDDPELPKIWERHLTNVEK
jgi:hypothetical protein